MTVHEVNIYKESFGILEAFLTNQLCPKFDFRFPLLLIYNFPANLMYT